MTFLHGKASLPKEWGRSRVCSSPCIPPSAPPHPKGRCCPVMLPGAPAALLFPNRCSPGAADARIERGHLAENDGMGLSWRCPKPRSSLLARRWGAGASLCQAAPCPSRAGSQACAPWEPRGSVTPVLALECQSFGWGPTPSERNSLLSISNPDWQSHAPGEGGRSQAGKSPVFHLAADYSPFSLRPQTGLCAPPRCCL